jgi:nicotinamide mononucleotide adenylyltransferase
MPAPTSEGRTVLLWPLLPRYTVSAADIESGLGARYGGVRCLSVTATTAVVECATRDAAARLVADVVGAGAPLSAAQLLSSAGEAAAPHDPAAAAAAAHPLSARVVPAGYGRRAVLVACGSYSPVTAMHLRMLEAARSRLVDLGWRVDAGILSPAHQGYGKAGLCEARHRVEMCRRAVEAAEGGAAQGGAAQGGALDATASAASDAADDDTAATTLPLHWITVSDWETRQPAYVRTLPVLRHFQGLYPDACVFLAAGADLVASMARPGVWSAADVDAIMTEFGVVAVNRDGHSVDPEGRWPNVVPAREPFEFSLSSTAVRSLLEEGKSVRYLVPDGVIAYIHEHGLFPARGQ